MESAIKPIEEWSAADILALPVGEFDWLEFKSGDFLEGADWQMKLSKYVSAWSNYSGGILIIGIRDPETGKPIEFTHGIPHAEQARFAEKLNSVLPRTVEPILGRFRFHFVPLPNVLESALVIQVFESEDAPHQARDHKYYRRRGRNLDPLPHRFIEDIRGRRKHPTVRCELIFAYGSRQFSLALRIHNEGRILARHVKTVIRFPTHRKGNIIVFESAHGVFSDEDEEGSYWLIEIANGDTPVFPSSLVRASQNGYIGGGIISYSSPQKPSISHVTVKTFADEAPPKVEQWDLEAIAKYSPDVDRD